MYIHRKLEKDVAPFLKRKEVLAVIGPRQAGKTTFLEFIGKQLGENRRRVKFITFEKKSDLEMFENRLEDFKKLHSRYQVVIIDEFQYAKDGGQKLKYLYDTTDIKFIISGSSSLDLNFQTGKYMVGRILNFMLYPFSFREYLSFADKELYELLEKGKGGNFLRFNAGEGFGPQINARLAKELEQYAVYGGYPAVALSETEEEKQKILSGIADNYLLKDIKGLLNLATEDELLKLSRLLASQIGNLLNYRELSAASGLAYKNLLKHLQILEKTFIIGLIRPYYTNRRTELTKNPKNYFLDLGMRNYLLSDYRHVHVRNDAGALMENYAFNLINSGEPGQSIKYWRTKSKAEVDFILQDGQGLCPVEIKYSSSRSIGKSYYSFIEKFKPPTGIIFTKDYLGQEKIGQTTVKFLPLSYF